MYEVVFSEQAHAELIKLPRDLQDRVIGVLERIRIRPYVFVAKVAGTDIFRLRVGKYRVLVDIQENEKRIIVLKIGNREGIYKNI